MTLLRVAAFVRLRRTWPAMAWLQFGTLCGSAIDWWAGLWHLPWFYAIPGDHLYDYVWRTVSLLEVAGLALVTVEAVGWDRYRSQKRGRRSLIRDFPAPLHFLLRWFRQPPAVGPTGAPPPALGGPAANKAPSWTIRTAKNADTPITETVRARLSASGTGQEETPETATANAGINCRYKWLRSALRCPEFAPAILSALLTLGILSGLHHYPVWSGYWLEPVFVAVAGVNLWCGFFLAAAVGPLVPLRRICRWVYLPDISGFERQAVLALWCLLTGALYSGAALSIDRVGLAGELLNCAALLGLLAL